MITHEKKSPLLNPSNRKHIQQVLDLKYHTRVIHMIILHGPSLIAPEFNHTERTMKRVQQHLDYMYLLLLYL